MSNKFRPLISEITSYQGDRITLLNARRARLIVYSLVGLMTLAAIVLVRAL